MKMSKHGWNMCSRAMATLTSNSRSASRASRPIFLVRRRPDEKNRDQEWGRGSNTELGVKLSSPVATNRGAWVTSWWSHEHQDNPAEPTGDGPPADAE